MRQSLYIVEQALRDLPGGPIMGNAPKAMRPPKGDAYQRIENARGDFGVYLVSDGRSPAPYRVKYRSPCFVNLQGLNEMVVGAYVADAVLALGSIDIVLGEVDLPWPASGACSRPRTLSLAGGCAPLPCGAGGRVPDRGAPGPDPRPPRTGCRSGWWPPLIGGFSLADFLGIFVLLNFILFFVMFEIWLERKVGGHIQLRRGPLHVGPHGALQSPADVLKLLTKEDLIPEVADRRTFRMAPYLVFVPVFMTFLIIPWGALGPLGDLVLRPFDLALVYLVAIPALQAIGLVIAGWSSGNKYALLGSARFVAQLISYELPMVVALLGVAVLAQSLSLTRVVEVQRETLWFIFLQPIGFLIFLVASMAEMSRTPFDIAIAESEIVGGPFIEYSGMRWGMFFLAEFAAVFLNAALAVALFMGGGEVIPLWGHLGAMVPALAPVVELVNQGGVLWFFGKTLTLIVFVQWCRFTLPGCGSIS